MSDSVESFPQSDTVDEPCNGERPPGLHNPSNNDAIQLSLEVPEAIKELYPRLKYTVYSFGKERDPVNVLSLVHNAAKRELADLVSVVLPALPALYRLTMLTSSLVKRDSDSEDHPDLLKLQSWWDVFIRFLFFVADTDDDVARIVSSPAIDLAIGQSEIKLASSLQKNWKLLSDRYAFSMEYIFRAADRAFQDFRFNPNQTTLDKFSDKCSALTKFMLDSMHLATKLVKEVMEVADVTLTNLEYKVANSVCSISGERKTLHLFMCARWMVEQNHIRRWIHRFGGIKGRLFFESWSTTFNEQRASFVERLSTQYTPM